MATKKTTTKSSSKKTTSSRSNPVRTPPTRTPPRPTPPFRSTPPTRSVRSTDLLPSPADVVSEPVASVTAVPTAPAVPVKEYVHMQQRLADFMKEYPAGVYFHADADHSETESAFRSLDPETPVLIVSKKTFTAAQLRSMGCEVFQNGKDGKLVGIRK